MLDELISRDEVLGGLPAKRASMLLFLVESLTAHMVARSRQAMELFLTEEGARERDLAFLEAFSLGREPPLRPTIQDLERYALQWEHLVSENPQLRAAVAHLLAEKYEFTFQAVPGIRAALGLDTDVVQQAYQHLYNKPLETIFASKTALLDRFRWLWAAAALWLESLPPFWTAFALTLTETVGAGILALPIAVAHVGPSAGVLLLILLGIVNVVTIASMAESVARSGSVRYGNAFFGRLVAEYLGSAGSFMFSLLLAVMCFMSLLAYYIGISTTLADATRVPAEAWAALLFLTGLYFLRAKSLSASVASSLLVGMISISMILTLSLLSFAQLRLENLLHMNVPLLGGRPFEPSTLRLVFGVIIVAYFGHLSIGTCAKVVLRRDASARSLIWGSVAAQATAIVLYCTWVLAVNGAVAPQALAGRSGTALAPLAEQVGPSVHMFGAVFVVLSMGMASIHKSLGLYNMIRERLPARLKRTVILPRHPPEVWEAVDQTVGTRVHVGRVRRWAAVRAVPLRLREAVLTERGRFFLSMSPVGIVFLLIEWLLLTGAESFVEPLSFSGVITGSLIGGIFPVLLLTGTGRKGEFVPASTLPFLGHWSLKTGIYLLFLVGLVIHGLVIWHRSAERASALIASVLVLGATVAMVRRGAFAGRVVVELREDRLAGGRAVFAITANGQAAPAEVQLGYPDGEQRYQAATGEIPAFSSLRDAIFHVPATPAKDLKVWAHRVTPSGDSEGLSTVAQVYDGDEVKRFDLHLLGGQVVLPFTGKATQVKISLAEPAPARDGSSRLEPGDRRGTR